MTYLELQSLIKNYLQNTETTFVSDIPNIIKQAEDRILQAVKLPDFRKNVTGELTSLNQYLSTPSDFLDNFSFVSENSLIISIALFHVELFFSIVSYI